MDDRREMLKDSSPESAGLFVFGGVISVFSFVLLVHARPREQNVQTLRDVKADWILQIDEAVPASPLVK